MKVRRGRPDDQETLSRFRHELWPESTADEHARELAAILAGRPPSTMPYAVFVCELEDGTLGGFAEVGLRSHADGCDPTRPVGFLEGWYVPQQHRRNGIGAALIRAAEQWAREQGCAEMASDTWADNLVSQQAHESLGFEVVDRCVNYRKVL